MTLKDVKVGQTVSVVKMSGSGAVKRRIMAVSYTHLDVYKRQTASRAAPSMWSTLEEI